MNSRTHRRFWECFEELLSEVQALAREKYRLGQRDPFHPPLQFKPLRGVFGQFESAHIIAHLRDGTATWSSGWIGTHKEYNNFIQQLR